VCQVDKDESNFYKQSDGRRVNRKCKECTIKYNRESQKKKRKDFREDFTVKPGSYDCGSVADVASRGEMDGDLLEWILALDTAQKQKKRALRKSEMFEVLLSLGYKKETAPPV